MNRSSRGTIPFIRLNDVTVEDSQFCIDYLSKVFQKDLDVHLKEEQKAISFAVKRMCEDSLKWCMALHRFWYSTKLTKETNLPTLAQWYFSYKTFLAAWYSGYGRYSQEELYDIGKQCLKSINALIGDKKFLLSNKQPSEVDAIIFGFGIQFKYNDVGPLNHYLNSRKKIFDRFF